MSGSPHEPRPALPPPLAFFPLDFVLEFVFSDDVDVRGLLLDCRGGDDGFGPRLGRGRFEDGLGRGRFEDGLGRGRFEGGSGRGRYKGGFGRG